MALILSTSYLINDCCNFYYLADNYIEEFIVLLFALNPNVITFSVNGDKMYILLDAKGAMYAYTTVTRC